MKTSCLIDCKQLSEASFYVPIGTTPFEILEQFGIKDRSYIAVNVNNTTKDFSYAIHGDSIMKFFDTNDFEGERVYRRTLTFILYKAIKRVVPHARLKVRYSIPSGFEFNIENVSSSIDYSNKIEFEIRKIVENDLLIETIQTRNDKVTEIFRERQEKDKLDLFETHHHLYYNLSKCEEDYGYYFGVLAHSTGYVTDFQIHKFRDGYIAYLPFSNHKSPIYPIGKSSVLYDSIGQHKEWVERVDVADVSALNEKIKNGDAKELIMVSEAMQNKIFTNVADRFVESYKNGARIILISGPSSSGKTTFSYRMRIQLRTFGLHPNVLSMDDYFINRDQIPIEENGERDFERFENVDLELFTNHLNSLLDKKEIELPKYNFGKGERYYDGTLLSLKNNGVVLVEGIHALNPKLTENIDPDKIFKVYLSPLTTISMDNQTYFSTDDNRLIRRIIRDSKYRSYSAMGTLKRWASVRNGERKYIFPYQGEADFHFNTSLFYELCALKPYIVKALAEVPNDEPVYAEAKRLLHLMDFFTPIDESLIPTDSIIREFIGGSSFDY